MQFDVITKGGSLSKWVKGDDGKFHNIVMWFLDDKIEFYLDGKLSTLTVVPETGKSL